MRFPIGAMSVGDILDRGLKLLLSRLPLFYGISLIALSPIILFQMLVPWWQASGSDSVLGTVAFGGFAAIILTVILQPVASAAFVYVVGQEFVDRKVSIGEALSVAFSRFGPLFGTTLLAGLIIFLGFLCFVIPGIYFSLVYTFIGQIVVLERLSGMPALNRSKSLIKGYIGRTFGIMFLVSIISWIVTYLLAIGLEAVLPAHEIVPRASRFGTMAYAVPKFPNVLIHVLVIQLASILMQCYLSVCQTLLYLDLRIRKEGFDLEVAAKQQAESAP
jgi:hypothetical protein